MLLAVSRDITSRKQLEKEKEILTYTLKERVKELSWSFVSPVAAALPRVHCTAMASFSSCPACLWEPAVAVEQ